MGTLKTYPDDPPDLQAQHAEPERAEPARAGERCQICSSKPGNFELYVSNTRWLACNLCWHHFFGA